MRALSIACFVGALIALAYVTKPTDQECLDQVHTEIDRQITEQAGALTGALAALITGTGTRYIFKVEDHVLYKTVVSRIDGRTVAVGAYRNVIIFNN